jgi:hypothetical protein
MEAYADRPAADLCALLNIPAIAFRFREVERGVMLTPDHEQARLQCAGFLRAPPFNVRKKRVTLMYELGHERHGDFVLPDRSYQN